MSRFFIRLAINALALYAAVSLIPGIHQPLGSGWISILWLALIFGLVNALVRPLLTFLTCPLIVLTLGLFTLIINTLLFAFTGWLGNQFGVGFTLDEPWFWNAFLGGLVVSLVSFFLTMIFKEERKEKGARIRVE